MGFFRDFVDTLAVLGTCLWTPWKNMFSFFFPKAKKSLNGEIVLLTGAGHGLGKELALRLSDLGAILVLWDINQDTNEATAAKIRDAGHSAYAYRVDITNQFEVAEVADRVRQDVGDVTMVINNAGVFSGKPILDTPSHITRLCFEVNVIAHFWIIQQFLPYMMEKDKGHIVGISSVSGHLGTRFAVDYTATKFGVTGLMDGLAMEMIALGKKNVKITTVFPAIIQTGLVPNNEARFPKLLPLLLPEDVAKAIIKGILREDEEVFVPHRLKYLLYAAKVIKYKNRYRMFEFIGHTFNPSFPTNGTSKEKSPV